MPDLNYFTAIQQAIIDMLTRHSNLFLIMGRNLFTGFAIILICWFGIRAALSASDHEGGFHMSRLRQSDPDDRLLPGDDHLLRRDRFRASG